MYRLLGRRSCCLPMFAVALFVTVLHLLWSPMGLDGAGFRLRPTKRIKPGGVVYLTEAVPIEDAGTPCPGLNASADSAAKGASAAKWTPVPSPQLGQASPYLIIYDWISASERPAGNRSVTLCTHATADSAAQHAPVLALAWSAPVSLAVFVLPEEICSLASRLAHLRRCDATFRRHVSVHLVYLKQRPPSLTHLPTTDALNSDCALPPPAAEPSRRRELGVPYPVNVARNAARRAARTEFVLVSDVELVPSPGAVGMFLKMMQRMGAGAEKQRNSQVRSGRV